MDPFCILEYNGNKYKTRTHHGAGKLPVWNHEFSFHVSSIQDDLTLKVMDEDVTTDDFIGMAMIKLSALCINGGVREWFTINYKQKQAGSVLYSSQAQGAGQVPNFQAPMAGGVQGYQQPPMGFQQPPMGFQQPPMGYQQQPMGFQQPPMGFQQQPMGYQQPPMQGYQQPGFQQPRPMGFQQQPMGYQQPPQGYAPPMGYQQPGYQMPPGYIPQQQMPSIQVHIQGGHSAQPHKIVNPHCHKCRGSGWNSHKNKPCGRCVCKKCGGSGWNSRKNKACKKMKIKH
ncbi:c2 domain containing protein [Stylonychia lemnae]|uniref:C2 domain containing protein n=1 Tax=Stylonychia lemnae TaxID=5949 RepID=A0A078AE62_STYLE|nr:c2 domain containing protein [Stylonychia lemnae]|eukprot:CDW80549.1 c2 domain containing protein [Stylonychia lemnae]